MHAKTLINLGSMDEIEKKYFNIRETAEMFNVNTSLLRYWEKEFDEIKPFKNKKGTRFFTQNDIEIIRTIYYLSKEKGYTLQGVKDHLKENRNADITQANLIGSLTKVKDFLLELKAELE